MKRVATIAAVLVGALLALAAVDLKASNHTQPSTAIGTVSVAASLFSPATRDPESPYVNRGSVASIPSVRTWPRISTRRWSSRPVPTSPA